MMNLFQRYKNYTEKEYDKYLDFYSYEFKPHFKWNPFDTNNLFVYRNKKWYDFLCGWIGVGYAWEVYTYWMRDMKYSYKLPNAFWTELSNGWCEMYEWKK